MRIIVIILSVLTLSFGARAQSKPALAGKFIIHRHLKVVGVETYTAMQDASGATMYSINCHYKDRGTEVPLTATLTLSPANTALSYKVQGSTSRHSAIDDSMRFAQDTIYATRNGVTSRYQATVNNNFPIDGYAPATMQWLLVKYWLQNNRAATIKGFSGEGITIRALGVDTLRDNNRIVLLNAYAIKDVIWGWEFLWTDSDGDLAALVTINAEGDKIEFIDEKYNNLLMQLTQLSAQHGLALYTMNNAAPRDLAITNCVLTDISTGKEFPGYTILTKDGFIKWTGPDAKAVVPRKARVVDAKGRHALPGLWDMHAHLKQVEWAPAYIAAGITTVRDMANEFEFINALKQNIDAGNGVGPTILRAGIIDGTGPNTNGIRIADTPDQAIALVKEYKAAGFEQVKLYGSLKSEIIPVISDEAHRLGMSVTGHIPNSVTMTEAITKGLDQVNHLFYVTRSMDYNKETYAIDFTTPANQKEIDELVKRKIVVDPTLALLEIVYRSLSSPMTDIEPAFAQLPKPLQEQFISIGLSPEESLKRRALFDLQKKVLLQLYNAGVPIVAGTDMLLPGYSLYRELELYVAAGLTPLQALQCATSTPAKVMQQSAVSGVLTNGTRADIILINGIH